MVRTVAIAVAAAIVLVGFVETASAEKNDPNLEAIGALTAAQLYTTYLYIGVTGDAYAKGVYKSKQVRAMMNEVDQLLNNVASYLKKVGAQPITEADRGYLKGAMNALDLLRAQAKSLVRYAGTGAKPDATVFEDTRKAAYAEIAKLLGLPAETK
jgi:hypothetical protein